jgi:hypothetical protein
VFTLVEVSEECDECVEEDELHLRELLARHGYDPNRRQHVCELAGVPVDGHVDRAHRHVHPLWRERPVIRPPGSAAPRPSSSLPVVRLAVTASMAGPAAPVQGRDTAAR